MKYTSWMSFRCNDDPNIIGQGTIVIDGQNVSVLGEIYYRPATDEENGIVPENPKMTGAGDLVAKATKAVGIKPCVGCKKRQKWLNEKLPFRSGSDG